MTTEAWLKYVRRKVADVDPLAERRDDEEYLDFAEDRRIDLVVHEVTGFDTITIDSDPDSLTWGISGASDQQAILLALAVVAAVLGATYRDRVDRGELGVSWSSGLESESTITADKAYREAVDNAEHAYDALLVIYQKATANGRPQ